MVVDQMGQWMFLALPFVYLVMVAQFQSYLLYTSNRIFTRFHKKVMTFAPKSGIL